MKANITVSLRIRPSFQNDQEQKCFSINEEESKLIINSKQYKFDNIFNQESTQLDVFNLVGLPILTDFYSGFSGTIFAYGQTASGKTHTLGNDGIIQKSLEFIFSNLQDNQQLSISYYEIYNEQFCDLLFQGSQQQRNSHNSQLQLREGEDIFIQNIIVSQIESYQQASKLIKYGQNQRITAATQVNERSSRSHAILTIYLTQYEKTQKIISKLNLVDLAGSERLSSSGVSGLQFKEMVGINSGLLALGNVISSLNENKKHIPYRDSKLTRVLQDSLGGRSKCSMIACINPNQENLGETINTLLYASRARNIVNKIVKKIEKINKPDAELIKLKEENILLKDYIENMIFQRAQDVEQFELIQQENMQLQQQVGQVNVRSPTIKNLEQSIQKQIFKPYQDEEIQEIINIIDSKILNLVKDNNYKVDKSSQDLYIKFLIISFLQKQQVDFSQLGEIVKYDGQEYQFLSHEIHVLINQLIINKELQEDTFLNIFQQENLLHQKQQLSFDIAQKCIQQSELQTYLNLRNEGFDLESDFKYIKNKIDKQIEGFELVQHEKYNQADKIPEVIEVSELHLDQTNIFKVQQSQITEGNQDDYFWSQTSCDNHQSQEDDNFTNLTQSTETLSSESSSSTDPLQQSTKMIKLLQEVTERAEQMSLSQLKDYMDHRQDNEADIFQQNQQNVDENDNLIVDNDKFINTQSSLHVSKLEDQLQSLQHLFYDDTETVKNQLKQLLIEKGITPQQNENNLQNIPRQRPSRQLQAFKIDKSKVEQLEQLEQPIQEVVQTQTPIGQAIQMRPQSDKRQTGIQQFEKNDLGKIPASQRILKRKSLRTNDII